MNAAEFHRVMVDPKTGPKLDRALAEDRELSEAEARKAVEAAMADAVRRYLNQHVPTGPR